MTAASSLLNPYNVIAPVLDINYVTSYALDFNDVTAHILDFSNVTVHVINILDPNEVIVLSDNHVFFVKNYICRIVS